MAIPSWVVTDNPSYLGIGLIDNPSHLGIGLVDNPSYLGPCLVDNPYWEGSMPTQAIWLGKICANLARNKIINGV